MKKYLIYLVLLTSYALSDACIYGDIDSSGSIDMYDNNGNYYYGDIDSSGSIDMYDGNGNHYYGDAD